MQSHIAEDGALFLLADSSTIQQDLLDLDLEQARLLTRLSEFLAQRVRHVVTHVLSTYNTIVLCNLILHDHDMWYSHCYDCIISMHTEQASECTCVVPMLSAIDACKMHACSTAKRASVLVPVWLTMIQQVKGLAMKRSGHAICWSVLQDACGYPSVCTQESMLMLGSSSVAGPCL